MKKPTSRVFLIVGIVFLVLAIMSGGNFLGIGIAFVVIGLVGGRKKA